MFDGRFFGPPRRAIFLMLGQRSFDELGTPLFDVTFVVLDLETTGAAPSTCEITEIGAVKYRAGELLGTFQTLVNPGALIPPTITVLTGITQAMVIDAPKVEEALPSLLEFIGGSVIVGHNIRFDMSFLNAAAQRLGYGKLPNRTSDTVALARRLVRTEVRNLKLSSLAKHFRSPTKPNHRALEDARATAHVFFQLLERAGSVGATYLEDLLRLPTAKGQPHYDKLSLTDRLPRRPGIYMFHDLDDNVIYVGKAKNLRERVRSYFYGDRRRSVTTMLRNLARVDHRVCPTELEAEITELRLIHAMAPRYNRKSRPPKTTHWLKLTTERYPRLSIVRTYKEDGAAYLGPFRSKRQAEAVMTAIWDSVPIRRCSNSSNGRSAACNYAQLGLSMCPCDGDIDDAAYAEVVRLVRCGIETEPELLLAPLVTRMQNRAEQERFEEAAAARDRFQALANALERRRNWQTLQSAGRLWAEDLDGNGAFIDQGRLVSTWLGNERPPLFNIGGHDELDPTQVPTSVALHEEAHLIWRWLTKSGVRVMDSRAPLVSPANPVPRLEALAG
ncbi:MAG: DEDD exonuclease domain-containing protein [Acidimicrobiia bacterium]|nr:DEDD exonuclease domain-containing protein [Acidimicrobiia bacterium]